MSVERIRALHWVYDHVVIDHIDDFVCAVDQKEAALCGFLK